LRVLSGHAVERRRQSVERWCHDESALQASAERSYGSDRHRHGCLACRKDPRRAIAGGTSSETRTDQPSGFNRADACLRDAQEISSQGV